MLPSFQVMAKITKLKEEENKMPKCRRCHRELKNHTESGMGEICRMKANLSSEEKVNKIRVEPLYVRFQPRRSYAVLTNPRYIVVVNDTETGRFAGCGCSTNQRCEHISLVADFDNARFPQVAASA